MQWWQDRTPRERLLIAGAGGILVLIILFQFAYKPALAYRADGERAYARASTALHDITRGAAEAKALQGVSAKRSGTSASMRVTITTTAHKNGVTVTRLEPGPDGGLSVWLEEVDAGSLQAWIAALQADHGITVEKATIRRHDAKPLVRAQIMFAGGRA